jgi:hypothetical protein
VWSQTLLTVYKPQASRRALQRATQVTEIGWCVHKNPAGAACGGCKLSAGAVKPCAALVNAVGLLAASQQSAPVASQQAVTHSQRHSASQRHTRGHAYGGGSDPVKRQHSGWSTITKGMAWHLGSNVVNSTGSTRNQIKGLSRQRHSNGFCSQRQCPGLQAATRHSAGVTCTLYRA